MDTTSSNFKSRWGFHPCNYEVFHKLKRLHGWYWRTVYEFHQWHRWWRKEPQNRNGREPTFCPSFIEDTMWFKPVQTRGEKATKVYPKMLLDHGLVGWYQAARMPQCEPVIPFDAEVLERIESLFAEVSIYFSE